MEYYRYFYLQKDVFARITDFNARSPSDYVDALQNKNLANHTYNEEYIARRLRTEEIMYEVFKKKGGKPRIKHPHYFTLGNCDSWFFDVKNCFGSLMLESNIFDKDVVSFTYGDSIPTFMDIFADGKEYRNNVYTMDEICDIINEYDYPQIWNTHGEFGPETYIEVQVWDDEYIDLFRPPDVKEHQRGYVERATEAIIKANSNLDNNLCNVNGLYYYLSDMKSYPLYNWYCNLISDLTNCFAHDPVHGISHSLNCSLFAFLLSNQLQLDNTSTKILVLSALYHDVGRSKSEIGKTHAEIGSILIYDILNHLNHKILVQIAQLIELHDVRNSLLKYLNISSMDLLVLLRDIDSLDYLRLGLNVFNPAYINTPDAKLLIRTSLELNILLFSCNVDFLELIIGDRYETVDEKCCLSS